MSDPSDERTDRSASDDRPDHPASDTVSPADTTDAEFEASDPADDESDETPRYDSSGSGMRGRDVEVPMRVYKTVTVFSTLIAVVCVVGGFVLLDRATGRAQLPLSEVDPIVALLGIGTILFGAATYAFGTRFRATGMGRSKNDDDEAADNG